MRDCERQMAISPQDQHLLTIYSNMQLKYEQAGGYQRDMMLGQIIAKFELERLLEMPYTTLSGSEKTRVALAKILLETPDVLLLDEPTNHLDITMIEWLENYLSDYKGSALIISHDRYFLDQVVDKIVEISNGIAYTYHGNYSFYQLEKQKTYERDLKTYYSQQRLIKNIEKAIDRFRRWGAKSDNPKFFDKARQFQKKIDNISKLEKPNDDIEHFDIQMAGYRKSSKCMIIAQNIGKSYGRHQLFKNIDFEVFRGQKVCLIGANGTGKSTILKGILGDITMDNGSLIAAKSAKIGYLAQAVNFANDTSHWSIMFVSKPKFCKVKHVACSPNTVLKARGFLGVLIHCPAVKKAESS